MKFRKFKIVALLGLALSVSTPVFAGGWYLMAPPTNRGVVYSGAPFSTWQEMSAYGTAEECERQRNADQNATDDDWRRVYEHEHGDLPLNIARERTQNVTCVATDDPRLHP
jgi:hypothetical protein